MTKTYHGIRYENGQCVVRVVPSEGDIYVLNDSLSFMWVASDGANALAHAILRDLANSRLAHLYWQDFLKRVILTLPADSWTISGVDILEMYDAEILLGKMGRMPK
jgi:hypothetical protein